MIEFGEGSAIRVSAGFSYAETEYGNGPKANVNVTVEGQFTGDINEALREAKQIETKLDVHVKQAVADMLGGRLDTDSNGTVVLTLSHAPQAAAAPAPVASHTAATPPASYGGGGNGGRKSTFGPPKVSVEERQQHAVVIDGSVWYDLRPFKADGRYKAGAADFQEANGTGKLWLKGKDGSFNAATVAKLEAAGIAY